MLMHQHLVRRMKKWKIFYDDIERAMADSDSKFRIITGDFNAKKLELKQKKKTSRECEHLEKGREMKEKIA